MGILTIVANSFCKYFSNIANKLAENLVESNNFAQYLRDTGNTNTRFKLMPVTAEQVTNTVLSLKNSSPGFDGLPMQLFKDNIEGLASAVVYICNLSFETGIFRNIQRF